MPFEFGDIVLVPFPFTNQNASKKRPAVVVSSRAYQQARPDLVVMAVTSQVRSASGFGEVRLEGWQMANLLKPSVVKPVFATLEQSLVLRSLGSLNQSDQTALKKLISEILG